MYEVTQFRPDPLHKLAGWTDVNFILSLMKRHSNALGFLPGQAIVQYAASGRILVTHENEEHAGYLLGRNALRYDPRIAPITQAAICMDARRRGLGLRLVDDYCEMSRLDGRSAVQCWCADDIDATSFWPEAGFVAIARRWPTNTRIRSLTLWRRPTTACVLAADLQRLPPLAGYRASRVGKIELIAGTADTRRTRDEWDMCADITQDDCNSPG